MSNNDFEFSTPDAVGLDLSARNISLTVTTTATGTAKVSFPDGGSEKFDVRLEGSTLVVEQEKPKLSARITGSENYRIECELPEGASAVIAVGNADIDVPGTLSGITIAMGSGSVAIARSTGPLKITAGNLNAKLGTVESDLTLTSGLGTIDIDDLRSHARVSAAGAHLRIGDLRGTLTLTSANNELDVKRAHEGVIHVNGANARSTVGLMPGVPLLTDVGGLGTNLTIDTPTREPGPGESHVKVASHGVNVSVAIHDAQQV